MNPRSAPSTTNPNTMLRAGVAKSDITVESTKAGIHDRLHAKALVLDDGDTKLAIISMDAVAIGGICDIKDDFVAKLRSRIEREVGIPGKHVMVHATHTHPPVEPILCDEPQLIERTLDAVRRASQGMTPVTTGIGRGREDRIAINRTLRMKNGKHWTIRMANPTPPDDEVEELGPMDPEIGILRLDRAADGRPLAVLYNYACHPLIGVPGGHISAMYPGVASGVIEQAMGDSAMAIFLQGAAGDITEVLYKDVNRPRDSESIGNRLGVSTLAALREIRTKPGARLRVQSETVRFPRRDDVPQKVEALREEQAELLKSLRFTSLNIKSFVPLYIKYALSPEYPGDYSYRYLQAEQTGSPEMQAMDEQNRRGLAKYMKNILAMEKLARIQDEIETLYRHKAINDSSGETTAAAEIQGIRIGDFVLIAAPFEPLAEIGLNLKRTSPHANTFIAGFSNGYLHYAPPAADYDKGGYEVTECMLGPGWQAIFEKTAAEILRKL